ncbi:interleukin-20 receptor subunit alpha-like, partial [Plectropomus leopardus]|uniref:interleukin-20 receptor subunit alpha-like n=1 Tax=Plectropomus leopardus TaxID=160734 RepID=UPI001C4B3FB7
YGDSVEGSRGRRVQWRAVRRCTEIVRSWCDLSNETWDLEHGYYGRVRAVSQRASSKWALTGSRFDPKTDTTFGPPLVSVEVEDNNAVITMKGPMRHQPNNHTPAVSMATLYPQMTYNLSIYNTDQGQTVSIYIYMPGSTLVYMCSHHLPVVSSYKYRLMDYNTKYCFSAKTSFVSMPAVCQSSEWHCITTPQDPVIDQLRWMVVVVVPTVCISVLVVAGYLLYRYVSGKEQKSPYFLNPPAFHPPPLTLPPERPNIILITVL